jgi:xylulose-5-phosphate/fructose-6-phosphate phosphoketolase
VMLNDMDRYHLVIDVLDRVPGLGERYAGFRQRMQDARLEARAYTREHGEDIPAVADWTWETGSEVDAREVNVGVGQVNTGVAATGGDNEG